MTWTNPPIVATGDFVTANLWNTYVRGNGLHLRGLLPDPAGSLQVHLSTGTTTAGWNATLPDSMLASPKVAKSGDTMTGDLHVAADIYAYRPSTPSAGYLFFASGGAHWLGYDGSKFAADGYTIWHSGNQSGLALVPAGLNGVFITAAEIASGWLRQTFLDGRITVGAGTTASVTFTEATQYGASWSHSHTTSWSSHAHGGGALGVTGTTSTESNSATVQSGAGASTAASSHTHTSGSLDVSGSTDAAGGGGTSSDQWLPLMAAVVWAYKT